MLTVKKDFTYFHKGYDRADYKASDMIDTDDQEMIEVALAQQWASRADQPQAANPEPAKRGRKPKSKE